MPCVTDFTAAVIQFLRSFIFMGREVVHELNLSQNPTRKSHRVWDLQTSVARTEVPSLHFPCDLSIGEVEIYSGNIRDGRKCEDSGDCIFQQEGAPPHLHLNVRSFLNESLPQWWIGCMGNENSAHQFWPPRSPDLTPCDIFLWGFVKDAVYVPPLPTNLNDLRNRITAVVNQVTQCSSSRLEWIRLPSRCYPCSRRRGHIEHL